eukprot:scaffold128493_cov64-Cyclotella_meneghiniana.AAC.2
MPRVHRRAAMIAAAHLVRTPVDEGGQQKQQMNSGLNNIYATLPAFAADPPENENKQPLPPMTTEETNAYTSKFRAKALRRIAARRAKAQAKQEEELFFENAITWAEDGHTAIAKLDTDKPHRQNIERGHKTSTTTMPYILQTSKNWGYALQSTVKGWARNVSQDKTHVRFAKKAQIQEFHKSDEPIMASLDSGADNHYISEDDRKKLGLPILKKSSRRVGVANGGTSKGVNGSATNKAGIASLCSSTRVNGSQGMHLKRPGKRFEKPTAYTISHLPSKR